VAFRTRKDQLNGFTENVQLKLQGEVKRPRLTRSTSCDPPLEGSDEMMVMSSMSAPSLVKDRSFFDGLQLDQPTSVAVTYALVNAKRKEPYQARNTNPKSCFEEHFVKNILRARLVEGKHRNHWILLLQKGLLVVVKMQTRRFSKDQKRCQASQRTQLIWMEAHQLVEL